MTQDEVRKLLVLLKEYYPNSFVHHTAEGSKLIFSVWMETFKDEDNRLVQAAVLRLIQENTTNFAPTIGQIREKMLELTGIHLMDGEEAFNEGRRLWKNLGTRNPSEVKERYMQLSEGTRRMLSIDDIIRLADMQTDDVMNYEKPRFLRDYKNIQAQYKAEILTGSISKAALTYTGHLMIGDGNE